MTFFEALLFFLALLNPFLLSLYLLEIIVSLGRGTFVRVVVRGVVIGGVVFSAFALTGDALFSQLLHVDFSAFQIFGGLLFLIVGIRFFFEGHTAIGMLRGDPAHLAGSIAMPFLIGPATVSAAIMIGSRLPALDAVVVVWLTLLAVVVGLVGLKLVHDRLRDQNARLIDRYVEITGRVSALMIGTFAVDMLIKGVQHSWALTE
ncbi:MAG: MarC family protein [Kofleriaceae bacterium]